MYDPTKKVFRTADDTMKHASLDKIGTFKELTGKKTSRVPTIGVNSDDLEVIWDWSEDSRRHQIVVFKMTGKKNGKTVELEAKVPVQGLEHILRMT